MDTTEKKIMRAKVALVLTQPFFATLMLKRQFIKDDTIETACTDGHEIRYNSKFVDDMPLDQLQGIICHELMHITQFHHIRREHRDPEDWNLACDYAINPIIKNAGVTLPPTALINDKYANMSAEAIYSAIQAAKPPEPPGSKPKPDGAGKDGKGPQQQPDPGKTGTVKDAPNTKSESEKVQAEAEIKQELAQAIAVGKRAGNLPGELAELVDEIINPKVPWREVLARFLSDMAKNDYTFTRPNMRYLGTGFIMPSLYNLEIGNIVLAVDTSSSIDKEALATFGPELRDVCSMMGAPITVIYCDTKVHHPVYVVEPDDDFKFDPVGRGGTKFIPVFEEIEKSDINPSALIYFTDLECHDFPESHPDYPVLWAKYGQYKNDPPFGEVVQID